MAFFRFSFWFPFISSFGIADMVSLLKKLTNFFIYVYTQLDSLSSSASYLQSFIFIFPPEEGVGRFNQLFFD